MKRARDPARIREAMAARDLTLREMGLLASCDDKTVRRVLAGSAINPVLARRFARILRRTVADLFVEATSSNEQDDDEEEAVA